MIFSDFMTFPVSLPDDGLIDVTAQGMVCVYLITCATWLTRRPRKIGRRDFLAALSGAKKGDMYWMDTVSLSILVSLWPLIIPSLALLLQGTCVSRKTIVAEGSVCC